MIGIYALCILFYFELGKNAAQARKVIKLAWDKRTVSYEAVRKRYMRYIHSHTSVHPWRGRVLQLELETFLDYSVTCSRLVSFGLPLVEINALIISTSSSKCFRFESTELLPFFRNQFQMHNHMGQVPLFIFLSLLSDVEMSMVTKVEAEGMGSLSSNTFFVVDDNKSSVESGSSCWSRVC